MGLEGTDDVFLGVWAWKPGVVCVWGVELSGSHLPHGVGEGGEEAEDHLVHDAAVFLGGGVWMRGVWGDGFRRGDWRGRLRPVCMACVREGGGS